MTIDSSTLRLLIELAQQRRDTAAAGNAAASAQRERAATTLQMLTDYRSEVREQSPASQGRVASRAQLQVLDRFAQRLDVAIDAQHRQHELQQAAAAQAAAELAARQRRLKAL
ncbi:MAG TPA: flagellar FliJ family protein, partial [Burkholderiaceae bacterium]|nr:flagellar FliJ family protein [Burkholderiaceae bacterium]